MSGNDDVYDYIKKRLAQEKNFKAPASDNINLISKDLNPIDNKKKNDVLPSKKPAKLTPPAGMGPDDINTKFSFEMDPKTAKNVAKGLEKDLPAKRIFRASVLNKKPGEPGEIITNSDLISSLSSKLKEVETRNGVLVQQVHSKEREVEKLTTQNDNSMQIILEQKEELLRFKKILTTLSKKLSENNLDNPYQDEITKFDLDKEEKSLKEERESYLKGDLAPRSSSALKKTPSSSSITSASNNNNNNNGIEPKEGGIMENRAINMPLIKKRIEQLNTAVENDKRTVSLANGESKMVKFESQLELPIAFWKNGLILGTGSFRPYNWAVTKAFLEDIFDGFFPYELKDKYPNGVIFKIIDKSEEVYNMAKDTVLNPKIDENFSKKIHSLEEKNELDKNKIDKKEFLARLPKEVVINGQIVNIKNEITNILDGPSKKDSNSKDKNAIINFNPPPSEIFSEPSKTCHTPEECSILKIKCTSHPIFPSMETTVTMSVDETLQDLIKLLERNGVFVGAAESLPFHFKTTFPTKIFNAEQYSSSFKQLDLFPRINLLMIFDKEKQN